jgi:ribosomal-protein-alanine N-acetyltransferase
MAGLVANQGSHQGQGMSAAVNPHTDIRQMLPTDLKAISLVERSAYEFPWSHGIFRDCLLAGYYSLVLEVSGSVSGYAIMSVAAAEAHILNICVLPSLHRLGYGRRLLNALLVRAEEAEVRQVFLEVRPTNTAALKLYDSAGFERIGVRPDYFLSDSGREDAVVLSLNLTH